MTELDRQRFLCVLLAVVAMFLTAVPRAHAEDELIREVRVEGRALEIVLRDARTSAESPQGSVVVRVDGAELAASVAAVPTEQAVAGPRTVVLLVDTSGSMKGPGIEGARAAAAEYLALVAPDVRVGLTTFSDAVRTLVPPTTDRVALAAAVAGLNADGSTSLNDGVLEAVRLIGAEGERRIVLLSDGADSSSANSLAEAVAQTKGSRVQLNAVAFGEDDSARAALEQLAQASGGRVVRVGDREALTAVFRGEAQEFSGELEVAAELPDAASGRTVTVEVDVQQGDARQSDSDAVAVPVFGLANTVDASDSAAPPPADRSWFGSPDSLPWAGGALFLGLIAVLAMAIGSGDSRAENSRRTRQVLSRYTLRPQAEQMPEEPGRLGESAVARSALELAGRVTSRPGVEQRLAAKLDHAALPLRPDEWVLLRFVAACLGAGVFYVLVSPALLGVPLGLALGVLGPKAYLSLRTSRRRKAFLEALPDSLQLVAGALSSGYSLPQALDTIVREGAEPIAGEVGRALNEARLGVPLEAALEAVAERMDCEDFGWVVMAIRVQREVGGNLAGVLTTVTNTLRERSRLRRQVKSLSAEGRLSAWVLIALPILLGGYMYLFNGEYLRPMYTTGVGITMLVMTGISLVIGALWMNKLVKVEV